MTDTQQEVIAQEVIDYDLGLQSDVNSAKRTASDAKRRSSETIAELNQWRWEMTVCPLGPRYSQREYAKQVGQGLTTIQNGAAAWQAHLDAEASDSIDDQSICSFGTEPHNARETPPPLTDKQIKDHDKARRKLDAGKIKAIIIERLAAHWGVVATTIEVNYREMVNEAVIRLNDDHKLSTMTEAEITEAADDLARQMRLEFQQTEARLKAIHKWMASNRGKDIKDIKMSDVRSMHARIERVMERKSLSWKNAEAEVRESDRQHSEAEKIKNDLARAARIAILDLRQSGANLKRDAGEMIKAVKRIEDDKIPLTDDERDLSIEDLDAAEAAIHLARAALTGNSGTDWDAALASLTQGGNTA